MSSVYINPSAIRRSKFEKHDQVHMSLVEHGVRKKGVFMVTKTRFTGGVPEYQLETLDRQPYKNGAWVREKDLKLDRHQSWGARSPRRAASPKAKEREGLKAASQTTQESPVSPSATLASENLKTDDGEFTGFRPMPGSYPDDVDVGEETGADEGTVNFSNLTKEERHPRRGDLTSFVPGDGIAKEVITADIQRYLGRDALVRPGFGTGEHEGRAGYWTTAYRTLTSAMISDLKADSRRWNQAQRREPGPPGHPYYIPKVGRQPILETEPEKAEMKESIEPDESDDDSRMDIDDVKSSVYDPTPSLTAGTTIGSISKNPRLDKEISSSLKIDDPSDVDSQVSALVGVLPEDQEKTIVGFTAAINKSLRERLGQLSLSFCPPEHIYELFTSKIKQYAKGLFLNTPSSVGLRRKRAVVKTIYYRSKVIATQSLWDLFPSEYEYGKESLGLDEGNEPTFHDRIALMNRTPGDFVPEVWDPELDEEPAGDDDKPIDALEISHFLTNNNEFELLQSECEQLIRNQCSDTMETIQRLMLQSSILHFIAKRVRFQVYCDIRGFVKKQYGTSLRNLGHMLAITGTSSDAQLTTVDSYFKQTWPSHSDILLTRLQEEIFGEATEPSLLMPPTCEVKLRDTVIEVVASGTLEFLIALGQQLAWLGAVCRTTENGLSYCTTYASADTHCLIFNYETFPIDQEENTLCWHRLIGDMAIITGFPIPTRPRETRGLQIPLEIMAQLGRVLLAADFGAGLVLKGDTGAFDFFPVQRIGEYVQWHLVDSARNAVVYEDQAIAGTAIGLSQHEFGIEELATTVICLGWTPHITNNAGTKKLDYMKIKPSGSSPVPEQSISSTGFQLSIGKIVTLALPFTVARTQYAPEVRRLDLYGENLRDLAERCVILFDTETRRGWLLDGERIALHILVHRQRAGHFDKDVDFGLTRAEPGETKPDVHSIMMANIRTRLRGDMNLDSMEEKDVIFAGEVKKIREKLVQHALAAEVEFGRLSHSAGPRHRVVGFEYIDLVQAPEIGKPLVQELDNTCGEWPKVAHRQLSATVLFGSNFQEILLPNENARLCQPYRRLPSYKSYLAAEAELVRKLVANRALSILGTDSLYPTCKKPHDASISCNCIRVQSIRIGSETSITIQHDLKLLDGAVILGERIRNTLSRSKGKGREQPIITKLIDSTNNLSPVWGMRRGNTVPVHAPLAEDGVKQ